MALPAGRSPAAAGASQVRRYHPPSGWGARPSAAMSDSPGRTRPVCRLRRTGSPEDGGHGERVLRRPTEERAARLGPLDEQVPVVLPGEADAAEGLERLAADEALAVVAGRLGHGDGCDARSGVSSSMAATAK